MGVYDDDEEEEEDRGLGNNEDARWSRDNIESEVVEEEEEEEEEGEEDFLPSLEVEDDEPFFNGSKSGISSAADASSLPSALASETLFE